MGAALASHLGNISVDLGVALRPLEVDTALLGKLLILRLLPLWKPSLRVGYWAWVLWVVALGQLGLSLTLHWDVDAGTSNVLNGHLGGLLDLLVVRHSFFDQLLDDLSVVHLLILEVRLGQ